MIKLRAILKNAPCSAAFFCFLVFIISTLAAQAVEARAAEPIRVGIFQNKPLVYYEGGPKGLFVEILDHVAKKENWRLEYVPCELQQCLDMLKTNKLDMMTALGKTRERSSYLSFSEEPVWTIWGTIYAQKQNINGIFDLKNKKIGVIKGSRITAALQKMLTDFNIPVQYVVFNDYDSLYKAFKAKKLDAMSVNNSYGFDQQRNIHSYKTPIVFSPFSLYFAAPINGGHSAQLAIINRFVKKLKSDKDSLFYAFEKTWFGTKQTYWTARRIGILSASFLFLTVFLMAFWRYRSLLSINKKLTRSINERNQAERNLRFTKFSIDHIADSVFWIDKDGRLAYANESACRNLGYSQQELLAMTLPDIDPNFPAEQWASHWKELQARGALLLKTQHRKKDRKLIPVEVVANYMAFEDMEYNCAVVRDITDRIRAEEKQAQMAAQLHQANKMEAIGTLAGGVAHDFNNMLSVILGYAQLIKDQASSETTINRFATEVENAAIRSRDLTRQLLAFSRKQVITPRVVNFNDIIGSIQKTLARLIGEDIEIRTVLAEGLWNVKIDPLQVEQILMNLAVNARDAMPDGGKLTIETSNAHLDEDYCRHHYGFMPGTFAVLMVSDNGIGMDQDTLAHVFEPFFTTKGVGKGTGLGLATVYGIVTQNEGVINVYSEKGQGTTFKIYLPCSSDHADLSRKREAIPLERCTGSILLVEDDQLVRQMTAQLLKSFGYSVHEASTPSQALSMCQQPNIQVDLIITDVIMPEMNGKQLIEKVHTIRPTVKVLFMSGYTSNVIAHHGVLDEGIHFIEKPFSKEDLGIKVREAFMQK